MSVFVLLTGIANLMISLSTLCCFSTDIVWLFGTLLTGTLPSEFAGLVKLQQLISFDTALSGQLPDVFASLTSLRRLSMGNSAFTGTLPPSLFQAPALELISLEENSISGSLPGDVILPAIRKCITRFMTQSRSHVFSLPFFRISLSFWSSIDSAGESKWSCHKWYHSNILGYYDISLYV